ncbi:hypothetical protein B0H13DRAFT_2384079 [Mycena leptocephala]|nr:hypothetical protein B0H13DRAFT_2384079 [Mycena leptocephala]
MAVVDRWHLQNDADWRSYESWIPSREEVGDRAGVSPLADPSPSRMRRVVSGCIPQLLSTF